MASEVLIASVLLLIYDGVLTYLCYRLCQIVLFEEHLDVELASVCGEEQDSRSEKLVVTIVVLQSSQQGTFYTNAVF